MSWAWPVINLGLIDSTNSEAKRLATTVDFEDVWLVANAQSAGRGRLERGWSSPVGNVYATALFHEPGGIKVALRVPFAAALAVHDAVSAFTDGDGVKLKWPNDVRAGGKKLSGILIETGDGDSGFWIAAGMGINVVPPEEDVGQAATSIATLRGDRVIERDAVLDALRAAFQLRLAQARGGFEAIRKDWIARAEGRGGRVTANVAGQRIEGKFIDLAADGALILLDDSGVQREIRAGDVNLIGGV